MMATLLLAIELVTLAAYLVYVAPNLPDCLLETVVLCALVLLCAGLQYR